MINPTDATVSCDWFLLDSLPSFTVFQQVLHASPEQSQPILLHLFSSSRFDDLLVIQFNGTRLVTVMLEDKAITHTQFCC